MFVAEVKIFITTDDPEDAARTLHLGLENQISDFPAGTIEHCSVTTIREATESELEEEGLVE